MITANQGYRDMVAMVRTARKVWRQTVSSDKVIEAIHLMKPEVGNEGAEKFFNWLAVWNGVPATNLARRWCRPHWCPLTLEHAATHESKAENNLTASVSVEITDSKLTTPVHDKDDAWQRLTKFVRDSPKEWQRMLEDGTVLSWGTLLKDE
jgi:hypothetical protein